MMLSTLVTAYTLLGYEKYLWLRGPYSILPRVLYALGISHAGRPGHGRISLLLWNHRLLIVHVACVFSRVFPASYWAGAAASCMVAVLVDLAGSAYTECTTASCMLKCLYQVLLATEPRVLLQQLLQPALTRLVAVHVLDVVLPGLLLQFLQGKAFKHWLQAQQAGPAGHYAVAYVQDQTGPSSTITAEQAAAEARANREVFESFLHQERVKQERKPVSGKAMSSSSSSIEDAVIAAPAAAWLPAASSAGPVQRHPLLYVSPVNTHITSFKFSQPPGTGPTELEAFKQQLSAALQAALHCQPQQLTLSNALAGTAVSSTAAATVPIVTQCSAFPGCYQLVFTIVELASQCTAGPAAIAATSSAIDAASQLAAQQVMQGQAGWALLGLQQQRIVVAGAAGQTGVALWPVAAALPAAGGTGAASSMTSRPEVLVSENLVAQLVDRGYSSIRVVVVKQPSGALCWDHSWQLQAPPAAVDGSTAAGTAYCLRLPLTWHNSANSGDHSQQPAEVLSVVVLAERPTAAAKSSRVDSASVGSCGVLAQLPLLQLPATAQQELQQLMELQVGAAAAAGSAESDCVSVFQDMLPILQDWATVILEAQGDSSIEQPDSSVSTHDGLQLEQISKQAACQLLCTGLTALFEQYDMQQCLAALHAYCHCHISQQQQHGLQAIKAAASDCTTRGAASPAGTAEPASGPAPGAHQHLGRQVAAATQAAVNSMHTSNRNATAPLRAADSSGGSDVDCSFDSIISCKSGASGQSCMEHLEPQTAAVPAATGIHGNPLVCALKWSLVGFGSPALEQAYSRYQAANLCRWDLAVALWFVLGFLVTVIKGILLSLDALRQDTWPTGALHIAALRALILAVSVVPHAVLWGWSRRPAGDQHMHARGLLTNLIMQHFRGLSLVGIVMCGATICSVYTWLGGVFQVAITEAFQQYHSRPLLHLLFVFVVNPMLYRAGPFAVSVYSGVYFLWLGRLVGCPLVFGLPAVQAVVLSAVSVVLCTVLDVRMRQRFLMHRLGMR